MKAKSMKLRTLVTLHTLYKHSDAQHRMNTVKLNKYLEPYGLDCTSRVLSDTVKIMKEFGIDVRTKGQWDSQGVWINDRPLSDETLQGLIFAITTNPYLSEDTGKALLEGLKPIVTEFQEPQLENIVNKEAIADVDDRFYGYYTIINQAIRDGRRVLYHLDYLQYDGENKAVYMRKDTGTLFTPKSLIQTNRALYMYGYNNTDKRVALVNLRDIADIKLSFKHKDTNEKTVEENLKQIHPSELIPENRNKVMFHLLCFVPFF